MYNRQSIAPRSRLIPFKYKRHPDMSSDHLVPKTRITIPRRRKDLVTRARLLDAIHESFDQKLILVTAPAGYGKTSLLVDFANQTQFPVCWYTVSSLDFELQLFIYNLASAVNTRFLRFGQRTISALKSVKGTLDIDYITNIIVNDIYDNIAEHFYLVLDDYYLVNDSAPVRNFLSRFIQDVDENCHLILTSRALLPLPVITTLAARSEVAGLGFEDLAFQEDEIQQLFQQNQNRTLTHQETQAIYQKTEGWITGILLSDQVNSPKGRSQPRMPRMPGAGLEDFFLQLVNQQTPEVRDLLLRTSLLEEFNPERCQKVIGRALALENVDWAGLMDQAQHANLFVLPVGEDGSWLRFHPLFLDFLQGQIKREAPEQAQAIERGLAAFYREQGDWDNAFAILRKLNQVEDLVQLIEHTGPDLLAIGRFSTVSTWLDTLPVDLLSSRPMLIILQGFIASTTGDVRLAMSLYDQALNVMQLPQDRFAMACGLVWRAGTNRMRGNLAAAITDAHESLRLARHDLALSKVKAEALRCIGLCLDKQGKSLEALEWLDQALATSLAIHDRDNAAMIQLGLGVVYENVGKYAQSMAMYQSALEHWQQTENTVWLSNVYNNLGVLKHITGDYQGAIASYEMALEYARKSGSTRFEAFVLTGIGDIYIELNALDEALNAYQQARLIIQRLQITFLHVYLNVQEAVVACEKQDFPESYRLLDEARSIARRENMYKEAHLCDLEYGGCKIKEGKPREVIDILENTCAYFEAGGHKTQKEKANLYLTLAYGQLGQKEKLIGHLIKVLACLNEEYKPTLLIAAANHYYDQLVKLRNLDFVEGQLEELLERISEFWNELPELRRYSRQHALAVPFAPPVLQIRALGKMQIRVNKRPVAHSEFQTQTARDLFYLLLAHPEGITKDEVGAIFWPEAASREIKFRLKNTVYRLRHAIGKDVILLEQDNYRFNNALDYEYDVEYFLKENALGLKAKDPLQKLAHFREAAKLYKGPFLPEISETWVYTLRESLQQIYLNILLQTAELYLEMGNLPLALEFCQRALATDDCLEVAYRLSFRIYAAMGDRAAVVRQYSRCCEVLSREIHTEPSPQTQSLYLDLLK
jgi:ATP/maltotriose-dependent transcriptional regulator MalT/DNA-binding SARP family transcriptional activator